MQRTDSEDPILKVQNLKKYFEITGEKNHVQTLKALDDVSFTVRPGGTLGVVGESGCGKTTLGRTIMHLYDKTAGQVHFHAQEIFDLSKRELREYRRKVQMIFQDPYSSLNPRKKVKDLISQPLRVNKLGSQKEISERTLYYMNEVGLSTRHMNRFPHQFSGGQRQRIGIARALIMEPEFIVCDEAVSALDVSIQAQILNLLLDIQEQHDFTYLFISHDLSVVDFIATRIIVMYLGRIVEIAPKKDLIKNPLHPYTQTLYQAFPANKPNKRKDLTSFIPVSDIPSPINPPSGCHFHPRCKYATDKCKKEAPVMKDLAAGHSVACWLY